MSDEPETPKARSDDPVVLRAELDRARDEAAKSRIRVKEFEDAAEARKAEDSKERESAARAAGELEKHLADLKAEREAEKRSNAQRESAAKKRILDEALRARLSDAIDPDVLHLIDRKKISIDDDYSISGIDEVVSDFRAAKPHFFPSGDPLPTPRGDGTNPGGLGPRGAPRSTPTKEFDSTVPIKDQLAAFK